MFFFCITQIAHESQKSALVLMKMLDKIRAH